MNNEHINSFSFNPTEFPFNIEISGISNCDEEYTVYREKSYCYILEYIYEGSGTLICNRREYKVGKGDAYLLPKGSNHRYYPDKTWDKIWFNIDGILVSNLIFAYGLENTIVFKNFNRKKLFEDLFEITNSKKSNAEIMLLASIQFHIIIQEMYNSLQRIATNSNVNKIKKMLDDNIYEKDISLKSIADNLCISQAQIINIFKRTFNMTPYQYFSKKRIEIAASLLLNSDTPIKEIAALLNYSDQPYFSNAFKKIMGISPEKYRKMNVNSDITKSNINNKILMEQAENLPFALKVDRH